MAVGSRKDQQVDNSNKFRKSFYGVADVQNDAVSTAA
jgi:hypothetical protein